MKKLIRAIVVGVLIASPVGAQQWYTANQITFAWDPVDKIVSTDTIKYQPAVKMTGGVPVAVGPEVIDTRATISFQSEGRYYLCVQALRYPQGESSPLRSEFACSDNPASVLNGQTFGVAYYLAPPAPTGLRLVP